MADNNIVIPLKEDFQKELSKDISEYLPLLSDNMRLIKNLLTDEQKDRVKQYQLNKMFGEEDEELQKEVIEQLKEFNNPSANVKKNDVLWKQYNKIVGKKFDKYLPLLVDNTRLTSKFLSEDQKKKVKEEVSKQKVLQNESQMRKLLIEANQMKLDTGLKSQFKGGMSARTFKNSIPLLAKNMNIVADVLTEDQKLKIKFYQQQEESAENQKEIAKILKEANKPKYQKIKDKLTEAFDKHILKNKWFQKSAEALKNMGRNAGHWAWELFKAFALLSLFDPKGNIFKLFKNVIKEMLIGIWEMVKNILFEDDKKDKKNKKDIIPSFLNPNPADKKIHDAAYQAAKRHESPNAQGAFSSLIAASRANKQTELLENLAKSKTTAETSNILKELKSYKYTDKEITNIIGEIKTAITDGFKNTKQKEPIVNVNVNTGSKFDLQKK